MRRLCAIAAAVTFSLGLWAPLLVGAPQSQLPSCCRREGKHKCGMAMKHNAGDTAGDVSVRTLKPVCPQFPAGKSAPAPYGADWMTDETGWSHPPSNVVAVAAQMEARYRISFARSGQKRGPPTFPIA